MANDIDRTKTYVSYAFDVLEGRIPACGYVKAACKRFVDDFSRSDLVFRYDIVDRVISFAGLLKHFNSPDPAANGTPVILSPWQQFYICNLMGWWRPDGRRRYTTSYLEVARKNAKTMILSVLGLYHIISTTGQSQVVLTANSTAQGGLIYNFVENYAKQIDPAGRDLHVKRNRIEVDANGSFCVVISSDYSRGDGLLPVFSVVDEYHEAPSEAGFNVLRSGAVSKLSHTALITTSGFDRESACYRQRTVSADVVTGRKEDDSHFALIYTLDEGMDWREERNWICASPNIGVSVSYEFYRSELQGALASPSQEINFRTKNCNTWQSVADVWIPPSSLDKVRGNVDLKRFDDMFCWMGVDLSAYSDMTAVTYGFFDEAEKKYWFRNEYYLPEACLLDGPNAELYRLWKKEGFLHITSGNCVDYEVILADIIKARDENGFVIRKIGYDSWNAYSFVISGQNAGIKPSVWEPVSQSIGNFNVGTKEMERIILEGECVIDSNPITAWMFSNVSLKVDVNGNMKPSKAVTGKGNDLKTKKIDGVISMIESLMVNMKFGRKSVFIPSAGGD